MGAIDVHVHPSTRGLDLDACAYFRRDLNEVPRTEEKFAELFIKQQVKALLIGWHPSTVREDPRVSNEYVIDLVTRYPDAFVGVLGSLRIGAGNSDTIVKQAEELLQEPKVKGFKFHPPDQGFYPNDRKYYELWEVLEAGKKPVMFHTGFTVLGANSEGGKGIALDYGRPIHLDSLARDFPRMKIIAAHPGWPWQEELLGVVTHKKNICVDTSGYLAEQLPEIFLRAIRGRLQDKTLFGTDFPYVDLKKALCSFEKLELKNTVKEKILFSNAQAMFGLQEGDF
ncbi:MAG: amidohydrolase family protein [Candidatus Binatia bacterium]